MPDYEHENLTSFKSMIGFMRDELRDMEQGLRAEIEDADSITTQPIHRTLYLIDMTTIMEGREVRDIYSHLNRVMLDGGWLAGKDIEYLVASMFRLLPGFTVHEILDINGDSVLETVMTSQTVQDALELLHK